jgi:serine/threonine protein kinase
MDAWKVEYKSIQRVPTGQIGKGGFATVHKVTWLGKDFAEKCLYGQEKEAIRKEASLLAGLSHPNILPLFCCATRDHSCSLVTELRDGDLQQLMERLVNNESQVAPFELLEAVDIMLQVAEGMNYLHQNRVVHRDLKSKNILVKDNEHDRHVYAKVADFGLSRIKELSCTYSNLTMDLGTTRWMAPELFHDSEDHNAGPSSSSESNLSLKYHFKVDVYSFGMVCYEILTGCVPFLNFKLMGLRKRIKDGLRPDMPEQCPEQLSTLVQACYHPDPKARPSFPDICVELRHIMCSLMVHSIS